jgi:hypothetical protein
MTVGTENRLFTWRVERILNHASQIARYAHLFDNLGHWDTALEKLDLRASARELREAADRIDNIERQIKGPETAFPDDWVDLRQLDII